jgi:hypothetical protein
MKRRVFVKLGILGAGAMTIPHINCRSNDTYSLLLSQPAFLSEICDEKTIAEIGNAYRKLKPASAKRDSVVKLLMTKPDGKKIPAQVNDDELEQIIGQKIQTDFKNENIVVLNGWVLSETEALQCALFSFSLNKK